MAEFNGKQGVWRTIGGRRVFIPDGYDLAEAMKESGKFDNYGVHYGDLGKAWDTTYFAINSSRRSTGHYGTGTYFISQDEDKRMQGTNFSRKDRPRKLVDFNEYNLYRPQIDSEAGRLHQGLKAINYGEYDDIDFKIMKDDLIRNGISENSINDAVSKVEKTRKEYKINNYDNKYELKIDSLSTIFMKELGYNGIDVRGYEMYDNTGYGSVIYDLSKKRRK